MSLEAKLDRAAEIVNNIRAIHAEQCQRCSLAYYNDSGTHDWRGWWIFRRPRCEYAPIGWANTKPGEDS